MLARRAALARAAWGAALLLAPERVLSRVHGVPVDRVAVPVARVLGARHLAQAALTLARPSRRVLALGVLTDELHLATGLGLAAVDPVRRRGGLVDAGLTQALAVPGYLELARPGT